MYLQDGDKQDQIQSSSHSVWGLGLEFAILYWQFYVLMLLIFVYFTITISLGKTGDKIEWYRLLHYWIKAHSSFEPSDIYMHNMVPIFNLKLLSANNVTTAQPSAFVSKSL